MKLLISLVLVLATSGYAQQKKNRLSEADRAALLQELDALKAEAESSAGKRFGSAASAFGKAVGSDKATLDLYINCIETIDFKERRKSTSDFRNWKKSNKNLLSDPGFAYALRLQLRWLMLTLRADAKPSSIKEMGPEAAQVLESIFANPKEVADRIWVLTQNVFESPFARAYKINKGNKGEWPVAPLNTQKEVARIGGRSREQVLYSPAPVYDKIIFPPLREENNFAGLRQAWDTRIRQTEISAGFWSGEGKKSEDGDSLSRMSFLEITKPQLEWRKEVDLFKSGDENGAAVALMKQLVNNLNHPNARGWEANFRELVSPTEQR